MMSLRAFKPTMNGFQTVFHTLLTHPENLPMIHTCIMWDPPLVSSPHGSHMPFTSFHALNVLLVFAWIS